MKDYYLFLTGAMSFIISLIALWRSIKTDKNIFNERYFRFKWLKISNNIRGYTSKAENIISNIDESLKIKVPEQMPNLNIDIYTDLEKMDWSYNNKLKKNIVKLNNNLESLAEFCNNYNKLKRITSVNYNLGLQFIKCTPTESTGEKGKKEQEVAKEWDKFTNDICFKCLGRKANNLGELSNSNAYKKMLSDIIKPINSLRSKIRQNVNYLNIQIDMYDSIFSE